MMKRLLLAALLALATPAYADPVGRIQVMQQDGSNAIVPSTYKNTHVLAPNVAETDVVPTYVDNDGRTRYANYVVFSAKGCDFAFNTGSPASMPTTDITDGSSSELNPAMHYLHGAYSSISLASDTSCTVNLWYYR